MHDTLRNLHCDANAFVSPVMRSGKSNKFGQMQELTNDNYSEIKLYGIFHIEYKAIGLLIKKNQQLHSRPQYWNDNEAAPVNGGFVNKANSKQRKLYPFLGHVKNHVMLQ